MGSLKAYRFRIYPDAKRQKEINLRIILAQRLYNKILERVKEEYRKGKQCRGTENILRSTYGGSPYL